MSEQPPQDQTPDDQNPHQQTYVSKAVESYRANTKTSKFGPSAVIFKVLLIFGLIVGLLIPLSMISGVIDERAWRQEEVMTEISNTWAPKQTLLGPVLSVPYKKVTYIEKENGKRIKKESRKTAYILPEQYAVNTTLLPESRSRGIYETTVYTGKIKATGRFDLKAIQDLDIPEEQILWKEAGVVLGVSHMKGVDKRPILTWDGNPLELLPAAGKTPLFKTGMYGSVSNLPHKQMVPFSLDLTLKGAQAFNIVPIGKQSTLKMASNWPSPSFIGNTLPGTRDVGDEGFTATWDLSYFARSYGQAFNYTQATEAQIMQPSVGVELLTPVDFYTLSDRATKYSVLFLALTFATYFIFEILAKYRVHAFQYLLIGFAMCLFYLLLISLSEVIGFAAGYKTGSVAIIGLISLYSKAILGKVRKHIHWLIAGLLSVLYGYLYVLLQLEDLSLLFGAIGLLVVVAIVMYVTRNINWYGDTQQT